MTTLPWIICILLILALIALHFLHQRRFHKTTEGLKKTFQEQLSASEAAIGRINRELTTQFQNLLEGIPDGLLVLDKDQRLEFVNTPAINLLRLPSNPIGLRLLEAVRWSELMTLIENLTPDQPANTMELPSPSSSQGWFKVFAALINPEGPFPKKYIVTIRDITETRLTEQHQREFVANISHELRTPVSHIKGWAETLLANLGNISRETEQRFLESILRNAIRLELIINDLLVLSALESGTIPIKRECVDLQALLHQVTDEFQKRATEKGITITCSLPRVCIWGDPLRIEQVLSNLIDNAIKYGRPNGHIQIGASIKGTIAEVFVADDGPGIPPEALERIFEKFYRVDASRSRATGGTGLGLAIVKQIIQAHGGKVWAESILGKGTTFRFTLPAVSNPR